MSKVVCGLHKTSLYKLYYIVSIPANSLNIAAYITKLISCKDLHTLLACLWVCTAASTRYTILNHVKYTINLMSLLRLTYNTDFSHAILGRVIYLIKNQLFEKTMKGMTRVVMVKSIY